MRNFAPYASLLLLALTTTACGDHTAPTASVREPALSHADRSLASPDGDDSDEPSVGDVVPSTTRPPSSELAQLSTPAAATSLGGSNVGQRSLTLR